MKQKLEQLLLKQNWGNRETSVEEVQSAPIISASINKDWKIQVSFDKDLEKLEDLLRTKNRVNPTGSFIGYLINGKTIDLSKYFVNRADIVSDVLYFHVAHEIGHWKYCPHDWDNHEDLLLGISNGLKNAGATKEEIEMHSQRVSNMFSDIIDNTMSMYRDKRAEDFKFGFLGIYGAEGILAKANYSKDFAVFIDSICKLGLDSEYKEFAYEFSKGSEISPYTQKVIGVLTQNPTLTSKVMAENLSLEEKVEIYHELSDEKKWNQKANEFAQLIWPLLKEEQKKEEEKEKKEKKEQKQNKNNQNEQNGSGQKRPSYKNKIAGENGHIEEFEAKKKELVQKSIEKGKLPLYADNLTLFDELYKRRAQKLIITHDVEEQSKLAIAYLKKREMGQNPSLNDLDIMGLEYGVNEDGKDDILIMQKEVPFFISKSGAKKHQSLPDILFNIDCSPSMFESSSGFFNPIDEYLKGEGKYDILLRSIYSIFKTLDANNQVHALNYAGLLFSDLPNHFTGWKSYYDLKELKEKIIMPWNHLNLYGTSIDPEKIIQATNEAKRKFWAIYVTDGEITNVNSQVQKAIQYQATKTTNISLINIKDSLSYTPYNGFVELIKSVGGDVHNISDPKDLSKILLGKARQIYGHS